MYGAGIILPCISMFPREVLASASTSRRHNAELASSCQVGDWEPGIQLNLARNQNYKEEIKESVKNPPCTKNASFVCYPQLSISWT